MEFLQTVPLLIIDDLGMRKLPPPRMSMSRTLFSLASFQVITIGRFWVIAEVCPVGQRPRLSCSNVLVISSAKQ